MTDRVGQQLGNYRLTRLLGQGGFADVYLGEHIYLETPAAIKVLQMRLTGEDMKDFLTEARTIAGLRHAHIVRVLDFGIDDSTPFLVMDYAPMGTLRQKYAKGTRLPTATIISYVKQVAAALQYAHDKKLIHRDIKPENTLLESDNEILLSDFGIATAAQSSRYQSTQEGVGTLAYMSPEQLQGKPRIASDQYSLGIVVYEWLTGDRPFHGSFVEMASQHMLVPPPPLREKVSELPVALEEVVLTALAKDPQQRFKTIQAFATACEQACQSDKPRPIVASSQQSQPRVVLDAPKQSLPPTIIFNPSGQPLPPTVVTPPLNPSLPPTVKVSPPTVKSRSIETTLFTYRGHSGSVDAVIWSFDGTRIASAGSDKTVQIWNVSTGDKILTYGSHSSAVNALAWSPNRMLIASASDDRTVHVWNATNGRQNLTYRNHTNVVNTVSWSPDGMRIASASDDQTVQVWDVTTGRKVFSYTGHPRRVNIALWSPDGRRLASASADSTVHIWDAVQGSNFLTYRGHAGWWVWIRALAWSPDGRHIASGSDDKTVQIWDTSTGRLIFTYRDHSNVVKAVAWSPDGKRLASCSWDKTVHVWDAFTGGNVSIYRGHSDAVKSIAWSPNGKHMASTSTDKTVRVWQAV